MPAAFLLSTLALATTPVLGQIQVGGPITTNTTWTTGNTYVVTQAILVGNGATLTIQPGVVVQVNSGLGIVVGLPGFGAGTLVARGTAAQPIRFTTASPPAGKWSGIRLLNNAVDGMLSLSGQYQSGSILEHCKLDSLAPASPATAGVEGSQCSPILWDCEILDSTSYGFYLDLSAGATPTPGARIARCIARQCSSGGFWVQQGGPHALVDSYADQCGSYAMYVSSSLGTITFQRNTVTGGGQVYLSPQAPSIVTDNVLSGSGGMNAYGPTGGTTSVASNRFRGCSGTALQLSGQISATSNDVSYNLGSGVSVSTNVVLSGNQVVGNQGTGVLASGGTIQSNVISFNGRGGLSSSGATTIEDNLINDNVATNGGGIYLYSGQPASLVRNTIARNRATKGGGLYLGGGVTSIAPATPADFNRFVGNSAPATPTSGGDDIYFAGSFPAILDASNNCYAGPSKVGSPNHVFDFFENSSLGIVTINASATCDPLADLGLGLPPVGGTAPKLTAVGPMTAGMSVTWTLTNASPNTQGIFIIGIAPYYLPFSGFVIPDLGGLNLSLGFTTDAQGAWTFAFTMPTMVSGAALYTQGFVTEPSLPFPFAFSNGVVAVAP